MKNIDELQSSSESEARPHKLSYKRKKQIKEAQLQSKIVSKKLKEQEKLKKVKKTKKLKTSDKDDNIIKKKSGIHKPCRLSNALAEFVGSTEESRPQVNHSYSALGDLCCLECVDKPTILCVSTPLRL